MLTPLAILCPPLAVRVAGTPGEVAKNIGLTLLFYVPGLVHALAVVGRHNLDRRYRNVLVALELADARQARGLVGV